MGEGQCREGGVRGLKGLMGSKDYMSRGSRGSEWERMRCWSVSGADA